MSGIGPLIARALSGQQAESVDVRRDRTARRILDAAVIEAAAQGIAGLTLDGVARRAGVNRVTVYRRFVDRKGLLEAVTMQEGRRVVDEIAKAMLSVRGPAEQFVEGFVAAVRIANDHPIIARMGRLEPERLIAATLADDGSLLRLCTKFVANGLRHAQAQGVALRIDADQTGETLVRLFIAFIVLPVDQAIDIRTDRAARTYAERTLAPMFLGTPAISPDHHPQES